MWHRFGFLVFGKFFLYVRMLSTFNSHIWRNYRWSFLPDANSCHMSGYLFRFNSLVWRNGVWCCSKSTNVQHRHKIVTKIKCPWNLFVSTGKNDISIFQFFRFSYFFENVWDLFSKCLKLFRFWDFQNFLKMFEIFQILWFVEFFLHIFRFFRFFTFF